MRSASVMSWQGVRACMPCWQAPQLACPAANAAANAAAAAGQRVHRVDVGPGLRVGRHHAARLLPRQPGHRGLGGVHCQGLPGAAAAASPRLGGDGLNGCWVCEGRSAFLQAAACLAGHGRVGVGVGGGGGFRQRAVGVMLSG